MQYTLFDSYTVIPSHVTIDYDILCNIRMQERYKYELAYHHLDVDNADINFDINMLFSLKESRVFFRVDIRFNVLSGIFIDDTFYVVQRSTTCEPVMLIRTALDSATTTEVKHLYPIHKCTLLYTNDGTYLNVSNGSILCEDILIHNAKWFYVDIFDAMKKQSFLEIQWNA